MLYRDGFLLLEASISLIIVLIFSSLLYTWHTGLIKNYLENQRSLQALYKARSTIEKCKLGHSIEKDQLWHIAIVRQALPAVPTVAALTVSVSHSSDPNNPLITLKTIVPL